MEIKLVSTLKHQNVLKQLNRPDGSPSSVYILKTQLPTSTIKIGKKHGKLYRIYLQGGPRIEVGHQILGIELPKIERIEYNEKLNKYVIRFYEV